MLDLKYLEWLKVSGKHALVLFLISSVLLFGSDELINILGLLEARETAKPWLGVIWLISLSITTAETTHLTFKWIKKRIKWQMNLKRLQKGLNNLTPEEKNFLSGYITNNTRTQSAPYTDGMINGLVAATIIYRSSNLSQYHTTFPYNIQPWAWEYLHKHPEVLN
ncbi:superinfection exclusion B family protein [Pseudomonas donghuensis]|uniref:superinfection exclusion B family protein n=1 Tax=Pseudomonas donghuensis TaxID=1163398 RepID=UPI000C2A789A|nr:superinfection exclusion B family protein [Pseudomonas donghuensis]PJY96155.1 hypothetical protein COO64_11140 [Pseudomonas donghuensis]WKY27607.1 superinfection exclusion B family protein [Pseudomonas donghuensis]